MWLEWPRHFGTTTLDSTAGFPEPIRAAQAAGGPPTLSADTPTGNASVLVRYWGTRGSIPSPGPDTVVFGGNTPCVEVLALGRRWILDAGTGIRSLGSNLLGGTEPVAGAVLLSHYHWDHIQGLPFFSPLYRSGTSLTVVGPRVDALGPSEVMERLLAPAHFPISSERIEANLETMEIGERTFEIDGAAVSVFPARHARGTVGFRLEVSGRSICYVPDNELVGGHYEESADWLAGFEEFVGDADLLIHDAMFTQSEYGAVEGWGHSTVEQAVAVALSAGVKRLALFHHAPDRTDEAIIDMVSRCRQELIHSGDGLKVWAARESETDVL